MIKMPFLDYSKKIVMTELQEPKFIDKRAAFTKEHLPFLDPSTQIALPSDAGKLTPERAAKISLCGTIQRKRDPHTGGVRRYKLRCNLEKYGCARCQFLKGIEYKTRIDRAIFTEKEITLLTFTSPQQVKEFKKENNLPRDSYMHLPQDDLEYLFVDSASLSSSPEYAQITPYSQVENELDWSKLTASPAGRNKSGTIGRAADEGKPEEEPVLIKVTEAYIKTPCAISEKFAWEKACSFTYYPTTPEAVESVLNDDHKIFAKAFKRKYKEVHGHDPEIFFALNTIKVYPSRIKWTKDSQKMPTIWPKNQTLGTKGST